MVGEDLTWFSDPNPAGEEDIRHAEHVLGQHFPSDFREFVKRFGGGFPDQTDFEFEDDEKGTFYAAVGQFLAIGQRDEAHILGWMARTEFLPDGLVPIALGGGGDYVCLDYRNAAIPSVVFWHHGRRGLPDEVSFVSETFSDFISLLRVPADEE